MCKQFLDYSFTPNLMKSKNPASLADIFSNKKKNHFKRMFPFKDSKAGVH